MASRQPAKRWVRQWLSMDREDDDFVSAASDAEQNRLVVRRLTMARRLYLALFALVAEWTLLSMFLEEDRFPGPWLLVLVLLPTLYTDIKIKVLKALGARKEPSVGDRLIPKPQAGGASRGAGGISAALRSPPGPPE